MAERLPIEELFDAEREARRIHDVLVEAGRARGVDVLLTAVKRSLGDVAELAPHEASMRLVCLARLLGELDGEAVADALIDVLGSEQAEARHEAGEQLQGMAFDRFKEVARSVERALDRLPQGSPALVELPFVLAEVPEPGVAALLARFLRHADADAVAAAIEALVEIGDPAACDALEALCDDERISTIADDEAQMEVRLGELAREAVQLLRQAEEER